MKILCATVLMLLPSLAFGDALATSICVLTKSEVDSLIKESGSIRKVATQQLWKQSIYREYIGGKATSSVSAEFKNGDRSLRLLATRLNKGKVLYSICDVSTPDKEMLVGAGTILSGEIKKNTDDEPFVVVLRVGNFVAR